VARQRKTLRNVLVVGGGYYFSMWLIAPLWLPLSPWLNRTGGHPTWLWFIIELLPLCIACALAGLAVGVCLETRKPQVWALALGGLVVFSRWMGWHWHLSPDLGDRARQAATSVIPGAVASWSILVAWRRADNPPSVDEAGA
jgi:hypothetical protein